MFNFFFKKDCLSKLFTSMTFSFYLVTNKFILSTLFNHYWYLAFLTLLPSFIFSSLYSLLFYIIFIRIFMFYPQISTFLIIIYELVSQTNLFRAFLFGFLNFLISISISVILEVVLPNQTRLAQNANVFFLHH